MDNFTLLTNALSFIEENLQNEIKTEDIARHCYCSKSTLEKLFRYVNHITVHEYIMKRRMVNAAKILLHNPDCSILDIAFTFNYNSNEAFSRAFKQVWNCNPSEFKETYRFCNLYPRQHIPVMKGDNYMKTRKNLDISELYDLFSERRNCYFICFDIAGLNPINQISRKAGDLAILTTMKRISDAASDEDIVFRIGGDEFALLTNSTDINYARELTCKIKSHNNEPYIFEDQEIPLSLHVSITQLTENESRHIRYSDLFTELHTAIKNSKKAK